MATTWIVWLMIVGVIGCGLVCALKGKWGLALGGLLLPALFWIPGAMRLAKPGSWWARRWYSPEKLALSNARFPKAKKTTPEGTTLKSTKNNAPQLPAAAHVLPTVAEPAADQRATAPPTSTSAPSATGSNMIAELERLATLHANGTLDEAEFRAVKARLLADSPARPVPPNGVASAVSGATTGFSGAPLAGGAAGVAGGLLLGNVSGASAAPTAGEPASETINYHETFTGPDGETTTIDGTTESTVAFDDSGDAHVEIHDTGTVDVGGDTSHYDSDVTGDVDLGGTEEGGGFLSSLFDLF